MAIRGVLLDHSGTLFRLEPGAAWVHGLVGHDGAALDVVAQDALLMSSTGSAYSRTPGSRSRSSATSRGMSAARSRRAGSPNLVDQYVLSYAEGFLPARERLGVTPDRALMIGDSVEADGAAATLGCRFERVEPRPTQARPDALISALRTCGIAG